MEKLRGIGKTTMLLQHIKQQHGFDEKAIYLSLDDIWFSSNRLIDVVEKFYRDGGLFLYLDEVLQKPEKIFLKNSNLLFNIASVGLDSGMLRETFILNQLKFEHQIRYSDRGDFWVDEKYILEVGGRSKSKKQIAGLKNAYIIADELDYAVGNKIPIWLFGLLY